MKLNMIIVGCFIINLIVSKRLKTCTRIVSIVIESKNL